MRQIKKQGYTLLELTIVIAIIGIIAIAMIPTLSSGNIIKLDLAAEEIADAARFAKAEAIRTSTPHGINTDSSSNRIRVFSLPGFLPSYDVHHPLDKKLYDIQFSNDSRTTGVVMISANYDFDGFASSSNYLIFSSEGIPIATFIGTDYMLTNGTISLKYQNDQRIVSISPMTGRVTIQ